MGVSERRKFKAASRSSRAVFLSRTVVINTLRLGSIVVVLWGELGIYFWSLSSCKWPEAADWRYRKPTHVLLLSDPQVRHPSVMRGEGLDQGAKPVLIRDEFEEKLALFFLGDMLSSGKYVRSEAEYKAYWRKFQAIFQPDASVPQYFLPGNNDVGMGVAHSSPKNGRSLYSDIVGQAFNQQIVIRDHVFICLDAPSLVDEDYQRSASGKSYENWDSIRGGSVEFVKSASTGGRRTVLLSHIPLYRPDSATCGPLREKGSIRKGVGHGYQNTLGKQTTTFLLKNLRPFVIFRCELFFSKSPAFKQVIAGTTEIIANTITPSRYQIAKQKRGVVPIREVTVKSFSLSNHIRRPGFQLVSLVDPTPVGKSIMDAPCLLPDPYSIYTSLYAPLAFLTLIALFVYNTYRSRRLRNIILPPASLSPLSNGSHTPLHPGHDVWSPYTPARPVSPRSSLPSQLRTPNAASNPTALAASRPETPLGSPLLAPGMVFEHHDEEEEDPLYPTQYAAQRNGHISDGEEWPARGDDPAPSYFLPVPGAGLRPPEACFGTKA
ncbi:Metallophos domain-containing protein [Mycena sanguinolenta]|uniref:Metallophos domain-containing protein n=1 Tax=Mycena sanguinolenta TaxID=230812 RepID=A0A8H7DL25_9AGAR|nr:Metallophos domain-containing protein [Mycena sanguinolenta]